MDIKSIWGASDKGTRLGNYDALRAICAIMVIYEHFCEEDAYNAFGYTLDACMPSYIILRLIYGISRTAVPVFFILSGYFSINSFSQRIGKAVNLFLMVITYSYIKPILLILLDLADGSKNIDFFSLLSNLLAKNYYLYLFVGIYALAPYINNGLNCINKQQYKKLIVIMVCLFSVWSTIVNLYASVSGVEDLFGVYFTSRTGTSMGFNIVNFLTCYIIGGYLRLYFIPSMKRDRICSIAILIFSSIFTTLTNVLGFKSSYVFLYYDSIFIIAPSIAMVVLFNSIKIQETKILQFLALNTFGTYVIHILWLGILTHVMDMKTIVSSGVGGVFGGILIFVFGTYLLSLLTTSVIQLCVAPINEKWKKTKLYNVKFY